ncbi:MAG TPA: Ig-like domain-containing protein [Acidothermaceae bacterium]
MKLHLKRALAGVSALAVAGGVAVAAGGTALAAAPWEPNTTYQIGTITILDANGVPVTSGPINQPFGAYYLGSKAAGGTADTAATINFYTPVKGQDPGSWSGDQVSLTETYNPAPSTWAAVPKALGNAHLPVVKTNTTDLNAQAIEGDIPNANSDPAWQNLYQLRMITSDSNQYDAADILISGSTWSLVPEPDTSTAATTTTTLTASPASPDVTSTVSNVPVVLTTKVTPAVGLPSGFTGSPGTVQITTPGSPATVIDTQAVPAGASAPYTITTNLSLANPTNTSYVATFYPDNGTTLNGSASGVVPYVVEKQSDSTATTLSVIWGANAGDQNAYSGTVTDTTTPPLSPVPVNQGTVELFDNGSTSPLNPTPLAVTNGAFTFSSSFASPGDHSVVAVYSGVNGVYGTSPSAPQTKTQGAAPGDPCDATAGAQCTDVQNITAKIPNGVLSISTPYTTTPLDLGTLALDPHDTYFTAHAYFGNSATDPTQDILITDTRSGGDHPWTAQAMSSKLTQAGGSGQISGENVGLTALTEVPVTGNGFNDSAANFKTYDNAAATPPVLATDALFQGLGNEHHDFAQALTAGLGSVGLYGTLTLNAPSSTPAGTYNGTITFTLVGSIVASG